MLISVIIPVFNRENFIFKSVSSVLCQTYTNWELLIIDDASTDDTYFSIFTLIDNKKVFYYYSPVNRGVSWARNFGIKKSRGDYIAFLDSDDYWFPNKLEKQIKYMHKNNFLICQTDEIWIRKNKFVNPKLKHKKIEGEIFLKSLDMCIVSPSAVLLHKKVLDNVGFFDETLTACEDYDLWLRISLKYKVGLLKEKLIVKRGGHDDQLSKIPAIDKFRIKSLLKLLRENNLTASQRKAVVETLEKKITIYTKGALKRNKNKEAAKYINILKEIKDEYKF